MLENEELNDSPVNPDEITEATSAETSENQEIEEEGEAPKAVVIKKSELIEDSAPAEEEEEEEDDLDFLPGDSSPVTGEGHSDFNWNIGKRSMAAYSPEEVKSYLDAYDNSMRAIEEFEIVGGRVTAITGGDVVLDLNSKSDGLIPLSEFRDMPNLKVGDIIEVYVEQQEDARGQLVLSRRKAKLLRAWDRIRDSYENGTVITGTVISKTKGGLIVD